MSHKLPTINAEELLSCPMPPTRFIIDQLLPQGLHILAGATKIGKSWLALALCLCVVKGEALWSFAAQKCGVLYLCLEDSYQRIRCRLLDLTEDAPDTLYFSVMSAQLHNGLEQQIEQFLSEHPNTGLVVIDTLQRVRGSGDNGNPYANDYRDTSTKTIRITIRATTGASPLTGTPAPSAPSSRTQCIWERWFSAAARQRASSTNGVWKRTSPSGL